MATKSNYQIGVVITAQGAQAASEIRKIDSSLNKLNSTAKHAAASFAGNLGSQAFSSFAQFAKDGALEMVRYSAKLETTGVAFKNLSGNAAFAAQHLKDLQQFSMQNALPLEPLLNMSQRLQAAGIEGSKLIPLLSDIGNVAAATGDLGAERLEGIAVALSQMVSKGKLSAEEMEQLAERGVPAWKLLADATGLSVAKLREMGEQGALTSDDLLSAFSKLANNKFGNAMAEQAKTGQGAWTGMMNSIQVTTAQAMEPAYKEISQIAVRMSEEIKAQGGDLEAVGEILMKYIGIGAGRATKEVGAFLGQQLAIEIRNAVGLSNEEGGISKFFGELERGWDEGFWRPILGDEWFEKEWGKKIDKPIKNTNQSFKDVAKTVRQMPDASRILNAKKAEEEAKRVKKEYEFLSGVINDLILQAQFFGDETEVGAVKAKLLAQGISDFNSGLAQGALKWAAYLDKLKENQKLQDENKKTQEKYQESLKNAREELSKLRSEADFSVRFADPTDVDRFNESVMRGVYNFRELNDEINQTQRALQWAENVKQWNEAGTEIDAITRRMKEMTDATGLSAFGEKLKEVFSGAELFNPAGVELSKKGVFNQAENILSGARSALNMAIDSKIYGNITADTYAGLTAAINKKAAEDLQKLFSGVRKKLKIDGKDDFGVAFIGTEKDLSDITRVIQLFNQTIDEEITDGAQKLNDVLKDLGVKTKSEWQEFTDLLEDPKIAKVLENEASLAGLTTEKYKEMLKAKKAALLFGDLGSGTRVNPQPKVNAGSQAWGGFLDSMGMAKMQDSAEIMKDTYREMGAMAGDVVSGMASGVGDLVNQWVLYGTAGPDAMRKMTASVLAGVSAQAAVKSVFQLAEGFASLFFNPAEAAAHFQSAALFASIAFASGLAGRAVAGDSFSGGKDSQSSSPDYQTVNSANIQSTNRNLINTSQNATQADVNLLANSVSQLSQKITGMRPGDVVATGIKSNPGLIGNTMVKDLKSNSTLKVEAGKALGMT